MTSGGWWLVLGWVTVVLLGAIVVSAAAGVTAHAALAVAQDALPLLLALAWVVLVVAGLAAAWPLAGAAAVLGVRHVTLLVPRVTRDRLPSWANRAPRLRLAVVNVFVDNRTPDALARQVLDAGADVAVVAEWNPTFAAALDEAGGATVYPERLLDPDDTSDYAVTVLARRPLLPGSTIVRRGPLALAQAVVDVGGQRLTVLALNPMAVVDPDGYPRWDAQMDELIRHLRTVRAPYVVAGDLNATTFRPKTRQLLRLGLRDAHESMGRGLSASFKLGAQGALAAPGAVVRLDHALTSRHVRAVADHDLDSAGSDHVPFVVELAVRPARPRAGQRWRGRPAAARATTRARSPRARRSPPGADDVVA